MVLLCTFQKSWNMSGMEDTLMMDPNIKSRSINLMSMSMPTSLALYYNETLTQIQWLNPFGGYKPRSLIAVRSGVPCVYIVWMGYKVRSTQSSHHNTVKGKCTWRRHALQELHCQRLFKLKTQVKIHKWPSNNHLFYGNEMKWNRKMNTKPWPWYYKIQVTSPL